MSGCADGNCSNRLKKSIKLHRQLVSLFAVIRPIMDMKPDSVIGLLAKDGARIFPTKNPIFQSPV